MKEKKTDKNQNNVKVKLEKYSTDSIDEIFKEFKTSYEGLIVVEIDDIIEQYGKNSIEINTNNSIFYKIKDAIINPFNIVLILVAIITFVTDVIIATNKDYATFLLIISTIIISAIISLVQETKSDNAAKKLKKMISNKIDVMIPGDVRFLEVKDLFVDQSSLTGESNPVEKFNNVKNYEQITDISNIGFMGTKIISSLFLPFLPLLPIHILIQNLLCDFAQLGMPFDNVDKEYIEKPKKWDTKGIKKFI